MYVLHAPDATQPDHHAVLLEAAPACQPKPAEARKPVLPTAASTLPPAREPTAAEPVESSEAIAPRLTAPSGNIALDPKPRSKTSLVEGVAFIVSTKVRGFDLHVQGAGVGSGCVG